MTPPPRYWLEVDRFPSRLFVGREFDGILGSVLERECRIVYNLTVYLFGQLRLDTCLFYIVLLDHTPRSSWQCKNVQTKSSRI